MGLLTMKRWVMTAKGNQFQVLLPAKRIVCPDCDGTGTELCSGLKGVCLSEEHTNDPDFMESYMGGDYDVHCSSCGGSNVVLELDWDLLSEKMKARVNRQIDEESRNRAEAEGERRMGA
jgi:hypothetical protein